MKLSDLFKRDKGRPGPQSTTQPIGKRQLVIGLDFGTAFTKVVIGEARTSYAVPFENLAFKSNPYLLPGRFWITGLGYCSLQESLGKKVEHLKMPILDETASTEDYANIVAFLSLVMKQSREWLMREHRKTYKGVQIDWLVNVGLPTDNYHDSDLVALYRMLVKSAWDLSVEGDQVEYASARKMVSSRLSLPANEVKDGIPIDVVSAFPEFVAQITGYVRSPKRQDDLHFLVDVGAGTVDATVFNVHERDGEPVFPVFAKSVRPLGTSFLAKSRVNGYKISTLVSPYDPLPSDEKFAKLLGMNSHQLDEIDSEIRKQFSQQLTELLITVKKDRYPTSPKWSEGIPLFACGGGVRGEFYQKRIDALCNSANGFKVIKSSMPNPPGEKLLAPFAKGEDMDRLSVAYGLSFDPFDIGQIIRDSEIDRYSPDPTRSKPFNDFVGKDHV